MRLLQRTRLRSWLPIWIGSLVGAGFGAAIGTISGEPSLLWLWLGLSATLGAVIGCAACLDES